MYREREREKATITNKRLEKKNPAPVKTINHNNRGGYSSKSSRHEIKAATFYILSPKLNIRKLYKHTHTHTHIFFM